MKGTLNHEIYGTKKICMLGNRNSRAENISQSKNQVISR